MFHRVLFFVIFSVLFSACTQRPKSLYKSVTISNKPLSFDQAVRLSTQYILTKIANDKKGRYLRERRKVVVYPYLEGYDYREMEVSKGITQKIKQIGHSEFKGAFLIFQKGKHSIGHYQIEGKLDVALHPTHHKKLYRLQVTAKAVKSGRTVANYSVWIKQKNIYFNNNLTSLKEAIKLSNIKLLERIREDRQFKNRFIAAKIRLKPFGNGNNSKGITLSKKILQSLRRIEKNNYQPNIFHIVSKQEHYVISGKIFAKIHPQSKKIFYLLHSEAKDKRTGQIVSSNDIWIKDPGNIVYKGKPSDFNSALRNASQHALKGIYKDKRFQSRGRPPKTVVKPLIDAYKLKELVASKNITNALMHEANTSYKNKVHVVRGRNLSAGDYYVESRAFNRDPRSTRIILQTKERKTGKLVSKAEIFIPKKKIAYKGNPATFKQGVKKSSKHLFDGIYYHRLFSPGQGNAKIVLRPLLDASTSKEVVASQHLMGVLLHKARMVYKNKMRVATKGKLSRGDYYLEGRVFNNRPDLTKIILETKEYPTARLVSKAEILVPKREVVYQGKLTKFNDGINTAAIHLFDKIYEHRFFAPGQGIAKVVIKPLVDADRATKVVSSKTLRRMLLHKANIKYKNKVDIIKGKKSSLGDYYIESRVFNSNSLSTKITLKAKDRKTGKLVAKAEILMPKKKVSYNNSRPIAFNSAVKKLSKHLFDKISEHHPFSPGQGNANIVINPFMDVQNLEVVNASQVISNHFINLSTRSNQFSVKILAKKTLKNADYAIQGYISLEKNKQLKKNLYKIISVARDIRTGNIVATANTWVANKNISYKPTPEYKDRPLYPPSSTKRSQQRINQLMVKKSTIVLKKELNTAAILNDAGRLYGARQYNKALVLYKSVLASHNNNNELRTYAGLYLSNLRLGHTKEAEEAFKSLINWSIKRGNGLSMKFLFAVNSTGFSGNAFLQKQYQLWLKNIGEYFEAKKQCFIIAGHSSHTGSAKYNLQLSLRRAEFIKKLLQPYMPRMARRLKSIGKGFTQNISGLGTDDDRDAIDRRVEFLKGGC